MHITRKFRQNNENHFAYIIRQAGITDDWNMIQNKYFAFLKNEKQKYDLNKKELLKQSIEQQIIDTIHPHDFITNIIHGMNSFLMIQIYNCYILKKIIVYNIIKDDDFPNIADGNNSLRAFSVPPKCLFFNNSATADDNNFIHPDTSGASPMMGAINPKFNTVADYDRLLGHMKEHKMKISINVLIFLYYVYKYRTIRRDFNNISLLLKIVKDIDPSYYYEYKYHEYVANKIIMPDNPDIEQQYIAHFDTGYDIVFDMVDADIARTPYDVYKTLFDFNNQENPQYNPSYNLFNQAVFNEKTSKYNKYECLINTDIEWHGELFFTYIRLFILKEYNIYLKHIDTSIKNSDGTFQELTDNMGYDEQYIVDEINKNAGGAKIVHINIHKFRYKYGYEFYS